MLNLYGSQFWLDEEGLMWEAMSEVFLHAFFAGIEGGTEILPPEFRVLINSDMVNTNALKYAKEYRYDLIKKITETTREQTQDAITNWIQSGDPLSVLEDQLAPIFGETRAERIAVTEVTRIFAEGNANAWKSTGFVNSVTFNTAQDDLVCPYCSPLDGQEFDVDDYGHKPPIHVNCILPHNKIVAPGLLAATKSFYAGNVVEITTKSGRRLTVTEQHPVLTTDGWVLAKFLNVGVNTIRAVNGQRIVSSIHPDYDYRPTRIDEVFCSLKKSNFMLCRTMPVSPEDFNGDGWNIYGNVEIVYPNRFLLDNTIPKKLLQPICKHGLRWDNMRGVTLNAESALNFFRERNNPSFSGNVSRGNLIPSLGFAQRSPFERFGFGLISGSYASLDQPLPKSPSIDSSLARKFVLRFSNDITLDEIVNIRNLDYSGHVYDLQ
ncbi:MAG: hypothetical protein UT69_C0027G0007, partial [Candidatus Yanofskybacteria bacterium GW2011_GWE1_40_10]